VPFLHAPARHWSFYLGQQGLGTGIMPRRSRAREIVLQVLYRFDLNPDRDPQTDEAFVRSRLHNNEELVAFAMTLLQGVMRNRSELDDLLTERADNWSLERMAVTDRNVMRIGAYEILYSETPGRVAINEAVDLARRFGSGQSSQFVNGVLDRFLQETNES
jgi:N utilization substance protein B